MDLFREKFLIPAGNSLMQGKKITCLDIGGAYGLQSHWERFVGNSTFYLFEPHEESYQKLIEQYKSHPHGESFKLLPYALAEKDGPTKFYATNCPTGSSLLKPNTKWRYYSPTDPYYYPMKVLDVDGVSLKTALDRSAVADIDAIKMDIQGAELAVLRGLDTERMNRVLSLELEVLFEPFYEDSCTLADVENFLTAHDMIMYDIRVVRSARKVPTLGETYNERVFGVSNRDPSIAQKIGEVDCIYFRNPETLLRNRDLEKLRKLIYIFCVYNFFADAMFLVDDMYAGGIISSQEFEFARQVIVNWQQYNKATLAHLEKALASLDWQNYGQYTWVPYPST